MAIILATAILGVARYTRGCRVSPPEGPAPLADRRRASGTDPPEPRPRRTGRSRRPGRHAPGRRRRVRLPGRGPGRRPQERRPGAPHLIARFNREGPAALDRRHGGGHTPTYDAAARGRILREVARTPTPDAGGTATWSLAILRRVLRAAPDGRPAVSTFTIGQVLRRAGSTFQRARTWCPTGSAVRRRKAGGAAVTDPDAGPKKS